MEKQPHAKVVVLSQTFSQRSPEPLQSLEAHRIEVIRKKNPEPRNEEKVAELIGDADGAIVTANDKIGSVVFDRCPHLKVIVNHAVGFDQFDIEGAKKRGIQVSLCPGNHESVAEMTWGLMHVASRSLAWAVQDTRQGLWMPQKYGGHEIYEKTLGVIGYGRIGQAVVRRAVGYRCKVLVYDPFLEHVAPVYDLDIKKVENLDELYVNADIISLHLPMMPENQHLLDREAFRKMKDGVLFVNTARGELVDEEALLDALDSGKVYAAGLDVLAQEPPAPDNKLLHHPNVFVAPHMAAHSAEGNLKMGMAAANALINALIKRNP
jgi:phosphoglycerate dehydrogenase-like enzyme